MDSMNWPDPYKEPHRYWIMVKSCLFTEEWRKRQQLKAVGLDYDVEPEQDKPSHA